VSKSERVRLDQLLFDRELAESLTQAHALVLAGKVFVKGQRSDKPGTKLPPDVEVEVRGVRQWASRGAYKLLGALDTFEAVGLALDGAHCLDVGASTGGFTDVMLKHGAERVIALDVGYGQLHERLRQDDRVTVLDRTNIRTLEAGGLPYTPTFVSIDTAFISVRKFLPVIYRELAGGGLAVILVKPQFELEREKVGKGGVVRSDADRFAALSAVQEDATALGFQEIGSVESPISGPKGNREFLLVLKKA
jgi:23S rRNA (cytidine1920-2'-O)/16S rRNA (cytidine1409-2'-O)-methyltransferase